MFGPMSRLWAPLCVGLAVVGRASGECGAAGSRSGVCRELQSEADSPGVALLQVSKQKVSEVEALGTEARHVDRKLPSLTDIVSSGSNILGNATQSITSITSSVGQVATDTALAVATTVNNTILALGSQASAVRERIKVAQDSLLAKLNVSVNGSADRLEVFEEQVSAGVGSLQQLWQVLSLSLGTATTAVASALTVAGQGGIADALTANMQIVTDEGSAFMYSVGNASLKLHGADQLAIEEVNKALTLVKSKFDEGYQQVDAVADQLDATFADITKQAAEQLSAALPGANATAITAAFDSVRATASQVVDEIAGGPKDFVSSLSEATAATREEVVPPEMRNAAGERGPRIAATAAAALLLALARAA